MDLPPKLVAARCFDQRIRASECMSMAFSCAAGGLHVNADLDRLEPVDRDYRPTPPGETSHTVL